ncbi:MAG TPA: flagellar basal body P-ring formation chaperone FlgA [Cellvibrio sp.]|nr:flagellar basal body P-ring formation chaperone FlgA [Cellvibrio sp.]
MELPSFYSVFLRNFLCHARRNKPVTEKRSPSPKAATRLGAGAILLLGSISPLVLAQVYPTNQLKQDIASFLAMEYEQLEHERIDINVGNLDPRLRLPGCEHPIEYTINDQTGLGGNINVRAQCKTGQPWSVHVPAQVAIYRQIPLAQRDIARGEQISQDQITTGLVNISSIRQAFLPDENAIIGKEAKRNISMGEPFRASVLDAPTAVRRGEMVTLESMAGSIKVSSTGTALADGRVGQTIRVRNNSSERIISGVVMSQGLIQTL